MALSKILGRAISSIDNILSKPTRYGGYNDITSTNLNSLNVGGTYMGYNMSNRPNSATGWATCIVNTNGSDQVQQILFDAQYDGGKVYQRWSANGGSSWSSWILLLTQGQVTYSSFNVTSARAQVYRGVIGGQSPISVLDSYYGSQYDGIWEVSFSGHSGAVVIFDTGGSIGTVQQLFTYGNTPQMRNRTDDVTWTSWKTL